MKIFITGNSGCGKTYIANKLAKKYKINFCSLDNLVWQDNKKREYSERGALLKDFLNKNSSWVVEGMSHNEWMHFLYDEATHIFFLNTSKIVASIRIVKRFIKKKIGIEKGHKETIKSLKNLFKIRKNYEEKIIPEIKLKLQNYSTKTKEVKSFKQIINFIENKKD